MEGSRDDERGSDSLLKLSVQVGMYSGRKRVIPFCVAGGGVLRGAKSEHKIQRKLHCYFFIVLWESWCCVIVRTMPSIIQTS
jgi:hypothetical protein